MDRDGRLASSLVPQIHPPDSNDSCTPAAAETPPAQQQPPSFQPDSIAEEEEEEEEKVVASIDQKEGHKDAVATKSPPPTGTGGGNGPYRWAVDLAATESYWRGWFEHLSAGFLAVPTAKLLLLAGVDRLDRDLTVAQMQVEVVIAVLL